MSILENMQDAGGSALFLTDLMSKLGLNQYDLEDPIRFERFKDIAKQLKNNDNWSYIVKKVTLNKQVDPLDTVWTFLELNNKADLVQAELDSLNEDLDTITQFADDKEASVEDLGNYKRILDKKIQVENKLRGLEEEIKLY
jgi:cell division protein FtsL